MKEDLLLLRVVVFRDHHTLELPNTHLCRESVAVQVSLQRHFCLIRWTEVFFTRSGKQTFIPKRGVC